MVFLYNTRSVVICLLAFAAFLRFDELAKVVRSDVKIENDILNYLSYKQRCCAEISSPEKSRYDTREKCHIFRVFDVANQLLTSHLPLARLG